MVGDASSREHLDQEGKLLRGIREVCHEFPGVRSFHVITARGEKRLEISAPSDDVNDALLEFLEDWLDRVDPPIKLVRTK